MGIRSKTLVVAAAVSVLLGPASPAHADALSATTDLISVSTSGLGGNGFSGFLVTDLAISGDGRDVAFDSDASDLVANDTNGTYDVFVRDRAAQTTTLADVDNSGVQAPTGAQLPRISADGNLVTFATNDPLVADDTNGRSDIYIRDFGPPAITQRVSLAPGGSQLQEGANPSFAASISADGRYVAYTSYSQELSQVNDDSQLALAVFDRTTNNTQVYALDAFLGGISANGQFIGFARNVGGLLQTYLIDRDPDGDGVLNPPGTSTTTLVSTPDGSTLGNGSSGPGFPSDFGDVAFWSTATNIGSTGNADILDRDRHGSIVRVGLAISNQPSISNDGSKVGFDSFSTNGDAEDTDGAVDAFVTTVATNTTQVVSVDSSGLAVGGVNPMLSSSGDFMAFTSTSQALLPTGSPAAKANVFIRSLAPVASGTSTPLGPSTVTPSDPISGATAQLTFDDVTTAGVTTVTQSPVGPPIPGDFQVDGSSTYLNIATSAAFTGTLTVCVSYDPSVTDPHLLHYDSTVSAWVDITTNVDTVDHEICGATASLSPFIVLEPTVSATTTKLTASADPVRTKQSVTYLATVSSTQPVNSGSVTFSADGRAISGCLSVPVSFGTASCLQTYAKTGSHVIAASYNPGDGFTGSTSTLLGETVTSCKTLAGCDLSTSNLENASLPGANLAKANLSNSDLRGIDLTGADLSGANLSNSHLEGASLRNADLSKANLSNAFVAGADFTGANLKGANLSSLKT